MGILAEIVGIEPVSYTHLARRQLVFAVLLDRKVVRVAGFQLIEHDIHGVLEGLIVLSEMCIRDRL